MESVAEAVIVETEIVTEERRSCLLVGEIYKPLGHSIRNFCDQLPLLLEAISKTSLFMYLTGNHNIHRFI